jgi:hypothetical protein
VKHVKHTEKDGTSKFSFNNIWIDKKGHAYMGGQKDGAHMFVQRTLEEMGDYSCSLLSSTRD